MKQYFPGEEPLGYKIVVTALVCYVVALTGDIIAVLIGLFGWPHGLWHLVISVPGLLVWLGYVHHEFPREFPRRSAD